MTNLRRSSLGSTSHEKSDHIENTNPNLTRKDLFWSWLTYGHLVSAQWPLMKGVIILRILQVFHISLNVVSRHNESPVLLTFGPRQGTREAFFGFCLYIYTVKNRVLYVKHLLPGFMLSVYFRRTSAIHFKDKNNKQIKRILVYWSILNSLRLSY